MAELKSIWNHVDDQARFNSRHATVRAEATHQRTKSAAPNNLQHAINEHINQPAGPTGHLLSVVAADFCSTSALFVWVLAAGSGLAGVAMTTLAIGNLGIWPPWPTSSLQNLSSGPMAILVIAHQGIINVAMPTLQWPTWPCQLAHLFLQPRAFPNNLKKSQQQNLERRTCRQRVHA